MKTLATALVALALSNYLCATPPGPGFKHIKFTGIEEIEVPPVPVQELGPGWMVYTVKKTLCIPRLRIDALVLYVEYTYFEEPFPDGSFRMHGVGTIMDDQGAVIGDSSFANLGMYLSGPPIVDFVADGTVAGTFWAGDFARIATVEKATLDVRLDFTEGPAGEAIWYSSLHAGFLLVPDSVDMKELRASLRDRPNRKRCNRG